MNYIHQLNAFYKWLPAHPEVNRDDIVLWHALLSLFNQCGWQSPFSVATVSLIERTRLSRTAVFAARKRLEQYGLIRVRSRAGHQAPLYEVLPIDALGSTGPEDLAESPIRTQSGILNDVPNAASANGTQAGTQVGTQPGTITKQRQNKTDKINIDIGDSAIGEKGKSFKKLTLEEFTREVNCHSDAYPEEMLEAFIRYWSEPDEKGNMKFQKKDTWNTKSRLTTWSLNSSKRKFFKNGTYHKTPAPTNPGTSVARTEALRNWGRTPPWNSAQQL